MNQSDLSCHLDIKAKYAKFFGPLFKLLDKMSGEQAVIRGHFGITRHYKIDMSGQFLADQGHI